MDFAPSGKRTAIFDTAGGRRGQSGGTDDGIEKPVRDLRVRRILEGTNEIMRPTTARHGPDR